MKKLIPFVITGVLALAPAFGQSYINQNVTVEGTINSGVDTGVANAYVVSFTPCVQAYHRGVTYSFQASNANTSASTVNVCGLGNVTIKKLTNVDLAPGDIAAGSVVSLTYDGTFMQMVSQIANAAAAGVSTVNTTGPITGGPITSTGTVACPTCATGTTFTNAALILGAGGQALQTLALGTANQVLGINAAGTAHEYKSIAGTLPVTITNGAGSITIAAPTAVVTSGSYADPAWLTQLAWSKLTGVPTFLGGPGTTTVGNVPQWGNTGGTSLTAGLGVVTTVGSPGSNSNVATEAAVRSAISASGGGTVSSVGLTVPSWLAVSGSPVTTTGTLAITGAGGQTANLVLATPNGSTGAVGLRSLVPQDIPSLPYVTSVGLSLPGIFSVSGSPVTSSGTLTGALANQSANTVFAGPASGAAAAPGFRALVSADIPTLGTLPGYPLTTTGDIFLGGASGGPSRLAGGALDTVLQGGGAGAAPSYVGLVNCGDSTHALSYNTSTHAWGCQAIAGGGTLTGSGTANTLALWTGTTALGNASVSQDATTGQVSSSKSINGPAAAAGGTTGAITIDLSACQSGCELGTLTGNVSGVTFSHPKAGENFRVNYIQAAAASYAVTWGASVTIGTPCATSTTHGSHNWQEFNVHSDGTTVEALGCGSDDTPTEIAGPERTENTTSTAGNGQIDYSSTAHTATYYGNGSSNRHIMPRTAGATTSDQLGFADLTGSATTAQLPGSGAGTVNNATCTLGASCVASGGTNTQTANYTVAASDWGGMVRMNCSTACAVTLPNPQPATKFYTRIISVGSTVATIALGSTMTFNGGASVPVLNSFRPLVVYANTATATDYVADAPLAAGSNVTLTPSANGLSIAASATGSTAFSALTTSTNTTATMTVGSGATVTVSGTGINNANEVNGGTVPASAALAGTNSSNQVITATGHFVSATLTCAAASASGTAYTCSTSPTFTPAANDYVDFVADVANTGSATLAVNGALAATIKKQGGAANLVANDLQAGHRTRMTYDGTNWQMQGQTGNAASGSGSPTTRILFYLTAANPATSNTYYLGVGGAGLLTAVDARNQFIVTTPMTITGLYYNYGVSGTLQSPSGNSTIQFLKGGVACGFTSQSVDFSVAGPTLLNDTTHTCSVTTGDVLTFKLTTASWTTSPTQVTINVFATIQ